MTACLNLFGSVMLAVVSGNEFQYFTFPGEIRKFVTALAGVNGVEGFAI